MRGCLIGSDVVPHCGNYLTRWYIVSGIYQKPHRLNEMMMMRNYIRMASFKIGRYLRNNGLTGPYKIPCYSISVYILSSLELAVDQPCLCGMDLCRIVGMVAQTSVCGTVLQIDWDNVCLLFCTY